MGLLIAPPRIWILKTKTAGYQVCYQSRTGRMYVLRRNVKDLVDARSYGRVASRVYEAPLREGDGE